MIGHEVVALRSWELDGRERMAGGPGVLVAETAEEAVQKSLAMISDERREPSRRR